MIRVCCHSGLSSGPGNKSILLHLFGYRRSAAGKSLFFQGGLDSSGPVRTSGCSKRSFDLLPEDIWLLAFGVTQPPIIAGSRDA